MKRSDVVRIIRQNERIIAEEQEHLANIHAGEWDALITFVGTTRVRTVQALEEDIAQLRHGLQRWQDILDNHPELLEEFADSEPEASSSPSATR